MSASDTRRLGLDGGPGGKGMMAPGAASAKTASAIRSLDAGGKY